MFPERILYRLHLTRTNMYTNIFGAVILACWISDSPVLCYSLNGNCNSYDFTDEALDIFVIDRTRSIGTAGVNNAKAFFQALIRTSFILRPDSNELAIYSFGSEAKTELDGLDGLRECELFLEGGTWDQINFDLNSSTQGDSWAGIKGALQLSFLKFKNDCTSYSKNRLWIASDLEDVAGSSPDISVELNSITNIENCNVEVWGVGVDTFADASNFAAVISDPCNYHRAQDWQEILNDGNFTLATGKNPSQGDEMTLINQDLCVGICEADETCVCGEFDPVTTISRSANCIENGSDDIDEGWMWKMIVAIVVPVAAAVVIFLIILIVCLCHRRRKKQNKKRRTRTPLPRFDAETGEQKKDGAADVPRSHPSYLEVVAEPDYEVVAEETSDQPTVDHSTTSKQKKTPKDGKKKKSKHPSKSPKKPNDDEGDYDYLKPECQIPNHHPSMPRVRAPDVPKSNTVDRQNFRKKDDDLPNVPQGAKTLPTPGKTVPSKSAGAHDYESVSPEADKSNSTSKAVKKKLSVRKMGTQKFRNLFKKFESAQQ